MVIEKDKVSIYIEALLDKSNEAYLMAIEIVNKPTIKYRTEGFCFYILNAWELLLKAFIIKQKQKIEAIMIEPNKNFRTISFVECVNKVFTSPNNDTRSALIRLSNIRNTATHLFLPEIDYSLSPLFQRVSSDYYDFYKKEFSRNSLSGLAPFISLNYSAPQALNENGLNLFPNCQDVFNTLLKDSESLGIRYDLRIIRTGRSDFDVKIDNNSENICKTLEIPIDPTKLYPYRQTEALKIIQENLKASNIGIPFNKYSFQRAVQILEIKGNKKYSYLFQVGLSKHYLYSEETISLIIQKISSDKDFKKKVVAKQKPNK